METELSATFDACATFNTKLSETLRGLYTSNQERKSEIEALRNEHEKLRAEHDASVSTAERENDLRKNEIKSLEEKNNKENTARVNEIVNLAEKTNSENLARKSEIEALDNWAKGENEGRKLEIANLDNFAKTENEARKSDLERIDNFLKSENNDRKNEISDLKARLVKANEERDSGDAMLNDRIQQEIKDRETAIEDLKERLKSQEQNRFDEMDALKTRLMKENAFLKSLASKPLSVYFDAFRTKAYDGGGEENLTFNGVSCNVGGGMDPGSGVFKAPLGGCYMFIFHIATHDNKKALLSIRLNGQEVASVFDQNHKDNHKNSMAGTNILLSLKRNDEVVVYAYTGTWLADFPMNHYTHWVGLLLKPSEEEIENFKTVADEEVDELLAYGKN